MKANVLSAARLLIASAAIAALASCGGGGGSGSSTPQVPTAPLALNSTNAQNVTGGVAIAAMNPGGLASPLFVVPFSATGQSTAQSKTHFLSRFMSQELARVSQHLQSPTGIVALSTTTITTPTCTSGSITLTDNRVNVSDPVTSGSETFNACSNSGVTINGSITFSNITSTSASSGATVSFSLTFSGTGFSLTTSGNFSFSETISGTVTTTTLSGTEILTTLGVFIERLSNFSFSSSFDSITNIYTDTISFTYASTTIGGSVTVTTITPFQTNSSSLYPHTGVLLIVGASGGRIRATVLSSNGTAAGTLVRIELDADNNGVFETTVNTTWAALEA